MEGYEKMYNNICRLCLAMCNDSKMVNLIDNSSQDGLSSFGQAISIVTNVYLKKGDILPTKMCQKCVILLKQTIYFKLKCESTDKQLKVLVHKNVNIDAANRNIKEIVCEYAMFNQYFPSKSNVSTSCSTIKHKKPITKKKITEKQLQKDRVEKVEVDINMDENNYDFDDLFDNEDDKTLLNNKQEENSDQSGNILDTLQAMINSGTNFNNDLTKCEFKREQRYYKPIPPNERNIPCNICHKILANRFTYDHHMQRHNNCKFICDQCGKGFPVRTELHMHQIARHGVGPYLQCDHCPYKAPRKLNLIEHLRIHTGERPFTCDKCGLTFRRRAIWRNHLVCHMEKQYQCTYCPRKFYRQASMLAHCNNVHQRMYMFMCSICSITYTKTETVRRHMVVKHGIPREKQGKIKRVTNESHEFPGKDV
ncbi:zinc finger protein 234-like [Helicoverpa armigera]|uniref:zinc finger protein 234-like n=1 Tax=Helicoverpa armigera TaxID=29058 RepID=UPI003082AB79